MNTCRPVQRANQSARSAGHQPSIFCLVEDDRNGCSDITEPTRTTHCSSGSIPRIQSNHIWEYFHFIAKNQPFNPQTFIISFKWTYTIYYYIHVNIRSVYVSILEINAIRFWVVWVIVGLHTLLSARAYVRAGGLWHWACWHWGSVMLRSRWSGTVGTVTHTAIVSSFFKCQPNNMCC